MMRKTRPIAVRDWMTRRVVSIRPDARLGEAAALMRTRKIRHLPVVERGGRLVGVVTARDLRQALFAPSVRDGLENLRVVLDSLAVRDVMTRGVISVRAATSIREAARLMHERKVGALPVVERDRLVGLLTESDILDGFHRVLGATPTSA
jgi:acetoin utilization protein AcuB